MVFRNLMICVCIGLMMVFLVVLLGIIGVFGLYGMMCLNDLMCEIFMN